MAAAKTTKATATPTSLEKLREPFTVEQVKQREGAGGRMLDYVAIETVLERLLTEAPDYSWFGHAPIIDGNTAVVWGELTIDGKTATGYGSMTNRDLDMAVKSANSEAMKNAAKNGWGVALELWDAEHREELSVQRQSLAVVPATDEAEDELTALKNRVADLAVAEGVERTGPAIAAHFGVAIEALQDRSMLERIIAQHSAVAV